MIMQSQYQAYLLTPYWREVSRAVKKRAGFRCQLCNSPLDLQAHHRTYEHKGDELNHLDDLICLCKKCHKNFHAVEREESRKFQRSVISGFFRVPLHMINDLEKATFSNIEHQDIAFVKHTLLPWFVNIEQRLSLSLLTPEEQGTLDAAMVQVRAQPERERSAIYRHQRRDGTTIEVEVISRPVELNNRSLRFASLRG